MQSIWFIRYGHRSKALPALMPLELCRSFPHLLVVFTEEKKKEIITSTYGKTLINRGANVVFIYSSLQFLF